MTKWFNDVFMPSIFERCGTGKNLWLSQKQTSICVENMEKETVCFSDGVYTYKHNNYKFFWNGREVFLSYSKKNSCGSICFGLTKEEQEKQKENAKKERERIEIETAERTKRHPNHLKIVLDKLEKEKEDCLFWLSQNDSTKEDIIFYSEKLKEVERKLSLYK